MGTEYRVKFTNCNDVAQTSTFLRALPCFVEFDEERNYYNYREEHNTGKMPDALIKIEDKSIYLCDCGMSRSLFGLIISKLVSEFGSVQVEDYE